MANLKTPYFELCNSKKALLYSRNVNKMWEDQLLWKLCNTGWFLKLDTGDFFEEWNEITPQTHIRKFEEQTAWGQVSCWENFLTFIGSSGLMQTLWMLEMAPNKIPVLKPFVLQIFWWKFGKLFRSILQKSRLYLWWFFVTKVAYWSLLKFILSPLSKSHSLKWIF